MSAMAENYVDLLRGELVTRRSKNPQYSERAFARSLGVSPGFLNLLFQGKKRLSLERANEISSRLAWTERQKTVFLESVRGHATTPRAHDRRGLRAQVGIEAFTEMSDWFYFAILELIKVHGGKISSATIAEQLEIPAAEAEFALKLLAKMGLIKPGYRGLYKSTAKYEVPSISSSAIRKYHRQVLNKAADSIDRQSVDEREFRGLTLAFDRKRLKEVRKFVHQVIEQFDRRFGLGEKNSVYHLNMAFFRMDRSDI